MCYILFISQKTMYLQETRRNNFIWSELMNEDYTTQLKLWKIILRENLYTVGARRFGGVINIFGLTEFEISLHQSDVLLLAKEHLYGSYNIPWLCWLQLSQETRRLKQENVDCIWWVAGGPDCRLNISGNAWISCGWRLARWNYWKGHPFRG